MHEFSSYMLIIFLKEAEHVYERSNKIRARHLFASISDFFDWNQTLYIDETYIGFALICCVLIL